MAQFQYLCAKHLESIRMSACKAYDWWLKTQDQASRALSARDFKRAQVFAGTAFEIAIVRVQVASDYHCLSQYADRLAESARALTNIYCHLGMLNEAERCLLASHRVLAEANASSGQACSALEQEFFNRAHSLLQMRGKHEQANSMRLIADTMAAQSSIAAPAAALH